MSLYRELLHLAQTQAAALASGDLQRAIDLLDARGALLSQAPPPRPDDLDAIREVLRLDGELSGAIRERMLAIRVEAHANQRGQRALAGYRPPQTVSVATIDRRG